MSKKNKTKRRKRKKEIDVEQILLNSRQIFLFGEIEEIISSRVVRELLALDNKNHKDIILYINSVGGSVADGFAIIDAIQRVKSRVVTVITGEACSMGGLISIVGGKRLITANSFWMGHNMKGGMYGNVNEVFDRTDYLRRYNKYNETFMKRHTRLNTKDLEKIKHGELWLNPQECLKKGLVDEVTE